MDPLQNESNILHRFEDLDDMFDHIVENLQKCVRSWIILAKLSIGESEKEVSSEILKDLVMAEFDHQYPRTSAQIEKREGGNIIVAIYLRDENKKNRSF